MKIRLNDLWQDYELIDCGNKKKLERFGKYTLIRPEISAENTPQLTFKEWENIAHAEFIEFNKNNGEWRNIKLLPQSWEMNYFLNNKNFKAHISPTTSKHIGVFPEQVINWNFINNISSKFNNFNILNLFAYTGLSSIISASFANQVTHVDSIKKIVNWAKTNAELSETNNIRFIVEDARRFVTREIKRKNKYNGIILDPPPIGIGPNKEKWILEDMLDELLADISQITAEKSFIIMNLYAHSLNDKYIHKLILTYFSKYTIDICEKVLGLSNYKNHIDHGYFIRLVKH